MNRDYIKVQSTQVWVNTAASCFHCHISLFKWNFKFSKALNFVYRHGRQQHEHHHNKKYNAAQRHANITNMFRSHSKLVWNTVPKCERVHELNQSVITAFVFAECICFCLVFLWFFCFLFFTQNKVTLPSQHSLEIVDLDVLIESLHLNGHTFRFRWTVQDLEVFLV